MEKITSISPAGLPMIPPEPMEALYLHIPFCLQKCRYCDFYSLPGTPGQRMETFVAAVLAEAEQWKPFLLRTGSVFQTVFFGGGTPTAIPAEMMRQMLRGLRERLPIAPGAEWTVETNPATLDGNYAQLLLEGGVNRLSVGAQSFDERELQTLGRVHQAEAISRTVELARAAGFARLSLDLIYAIPGQTPASWQRSLDAALALQVDHLSCYCLTLEPHTPMWQMVQEGLLLLPEEQAQLQFMKQTRRVLQEKGLAAYEISNYCREGEECRHNLVYWQGGNYLGLGPAAASHDAGCRWRNAPQLEQYLARSDNLELAVLDFEQLSLEQRCCELAMLMLRTTPGIDRRRFEQILGVDAGVIFRANLEKLLSLGLLQSDQQGIRLTEKGVYVADEVTAELVGEIG